MRRFPEFFLFIGVAFFAGCAAYEPQPVSQHAPSVWIVPITNRSVSAPQSVEPLLRSLRLALATHPAVRLATSPDTADAELRIEILGIGREDLARDRADSGRPLSYRSSFSVRVEWIGGPAPWGLPNPRIFEAAQPVYTQPSLVEAEYQAMGLLADSIANQIVEQMTLNWDRHGT